jgi:endonuclease YncB( thermonuclease family)
MSPVIPFRGRSNLPIALGAIAVAVIAFAATTMYMNWESNPHPPTKIKIIRPEKPSRPQSGPSQPTNVRIFRPEKNIRPEAREPGRIEVVDGDTVRFNGAAYRLIGYDTPERGDKARCDNERRRAEAATNRLRALIGSGDVQLRPVSCSCRPGEEGTPNCNFDRLCGALSIGGRDAGGILIGEGLAHPYVCGVTSCPPRRQWCDRR